MVFFLINKTIYYGNDLDTRLSFDGKTEPSSPNDRDREKDRYERRDIPPSFSRCSSTSSIHTLSSSAQNTGSIISHSIES